MSAAVTAITERVLRFATRAPRGTEGRSTVSSYRWTDDKKMVELPRNSVVVGILGETLQSGGGFNSNQLAANRSKGSKKAGHPVVLHYSFGETRQ
ncbi:hypothetical protein Poly41_11290 [Novipirellula artificiosorum]|uniref:Uncharacterized protein n=1 Tax=Novipirellula artificiosorum TaxID=2528016 RepID=A0A5C6E1U8_9BACT|nr:hypothetical protein Poly41_11290 [Novipirellula artificiosorum]